MAPKRKYEVTKAEIIDQWAKEYPKVMTWLAKLQRKNHNAWHLWLYCKTTGKTPEELLALKKDPRNRDAEYLLDKFVADETLGLTNSVKVNVVIAVRSFYKHNYIDLAKASGQITFIKKFPYRKHTKEELLKIYRSTQNPRDRALITFVWSTAIARESLTKIQWKHLETDWEKREIPHIGLPDKLIKGHGRGKYRGVEQHTFLTNEARRDLIDYKDWLERMKDIKLTSEDHVFVELHPPYKSIGYAALTKISYALSRRSGVKFSWHDARRYVETALEETKIHPNWARKIRGRKVRGEEAPYSRPAIEQLRNAYREAVPLLEFTQPTQLMELQKRQEILEEIQSKILSAEPLTDQDRENIRRYRIRLGYKPKKRKGKVDGNDEDCPDGEHCGRFEQIPEANLLEYLRQGWQIVKETNNGKEVIVKKQ